MGRAIPAPRVTDRHEVVVEGGGQAGLAIGYFLAQQGRRFTSLEAADEQAPEGRRLALALVRLLAEGESVTMAAFAEAAGVEREVVEELVDGVPGLLRDDHGRVISFLGFSLTETPHRLELGDATLHAWCAWDTLCLPRLIDRTARGRSACRQTGETISLTASRDADPNSLTSARVPAARRRRGAKRRSRLGDRGPAVVMTPAEDAANSTKAAPVEIRGHTEDEEGRDDDPQPS